jgi:dihydrofolate synthase/folylpolyglutamate synthase
MDSPRRTRPAIRSPSIDWMLPTPDEVVSDADYRAALDYLYGLSATPRPAAAIRADQPRKLPRMRHLLTLAGEPQQRFPSILIAGTKGKGSTAAMLATTLQAGGLHVGRYTQPHLVSYRERVWVDGEHVPANMVATLAWELQPLVEAAQHMAPDLGRYTTFEVGTALALLYFAHANVDLAVVEVGVGGTHDATNVLDPLVSVVTPISADHLDTLGPTLADVARAKAGILRSGRPAAIGPQTKEVARVLRAEAARLGVPLAWVGRDWRWQPETTKPAAGSFTLLGPSARYDRLTLPLLGRHQRDNAAVTVAAVQALGNTGIQVAPDAIVRGLASVAWPGRIQVLPTTPPIVVDGAHNAASATVLRETVRECFPGRAITLVLGCTGDKDLAAIVDALVPTASHVVAARAHHPRAAPVEVVAAAAKAAGARVAAATSVAVAMVAAIADTPVDGLVLAAGSLFLAGEALAYAATLPRAE